MGNAGSFINYDLVSPAMTRLVLDLAATNNAFLLTNTRLPVLHFIMEASTNQALKAAAEARLTVALEESQELDRFTALIAFAAQPRTNAFSVQAGERVRNHINEWRVTGQSEKVDTLLRAANEDGLKQWVATQASAVGKELLDQALQAARQLITDRSEAITAEDYARNFTVDGTLLSALVSEIKQKRKFKDEQGVRISYSENLIAPSLTIIPQDEAPAKLPASSVIEDSFTGGGISYRRHSYKNLGITYESVKRQGRANGLTVLTEVYTLGGQHFRRSEIEGLSNVN